MRRIVMADFLFLVTTVAFFALAVGYAYGCDTL